MKHLFCGIVLASLSLTRTEATDGFSPVTLAVTKAGQTLYVAEYTANQVSKVDGSSYKVEPLAMPLPPSGLAMSADGSRLYVTCAGVRSQVGVVDVAQWQIIGTLPANARTPQPHPRTNHPHQSGSAPDLDGHEPGKRRALQRRGPIPRRRPEKHRESFLNQAAFPRTAGAALCAAIK